MSTEVELKLLVARDQLARALSVAAVKRQARGRARTSELFSVYYDTPDFALRSQGLALRLRRVRTRWVQGLKSGGGGAAGLHRRDEYEWPLASRRLDLSLLDATPHAAAFGKRRVREALRPVFSTRFRRTLRPLALTDTVEAELCADLGEIRAGARRAPISEIEIEVVRGGGGAAALFSFAQELLNEVPFRLGAFSKAERGYALAGKDQGRPRKAQTVALAPEMSREEALRAVAQGCLDQIHANEQGFLEGGDPEYLHQLRVGFRRLRVALSLPDDPEWRAALDPVREELRWLFSALGPARNWDIFITELLPPLAKHFGAQESIVALRARCQRLRRKHLAAARQAVDSTRYQNLLLSIGALLAGPVPGGAPDGSAPARQFAAQAIARRERSLRRSGEELSGASAEQRHRVRIAAKKLRYCVEFFASLYPRRKIERYAEALAELQDLLGAINDAAVAASMIAAAGQTGRSDPRALGMVQGWIAAGEARAIERLPRQWKGFAARKPFWD